MTVCEAVKNFIYAGAEKFVSEVTEHSEEIPRITGISVGGSALLSYGATYFLVKGATPFVTGSVAAVANLITLIASSAFLKDSTPYKQLFTLSSASVVVISLGSMVAGFPLSIPTLLLVIVINIATLALTGERDNANDFLKKRVKTVVQNLTQTPKPAAIIALITIGGSTLLGCGVTPLLIKGTRPFIAGSIAAAASLISVIVGFSFQDSSNKQSAAFSSTSVVVISLGSMAAGFPLSIPTMLLVTAGNTATTFLSTMAALALL